MVATATKIKDAVLDGFDSLVDSKFGLIVLTAALLAFMGFGLPAIVTTIIDATAEGYSGPAIIQEHKISGSFCNIRVLKEDGTEEILVAGPRGVCGNVEDSTVINMKNGQIKN